MNRLPGLDLDRLHAYLTDSMSVPPAHRLRGELISGGRSNLTYLITDGVRDWVVRRPPEGKIMPAAHDVGREYKVMSALATSPVPVPAVVLMCTDTSIIGTDFYMMDKVSGSVIRTLDQFSAFSPQARRRVACDLVDVLADLHLIDPRDVGLESLGRPEGYLERQLDRWTRQYRAIEVRDLPRMHSLADELRSTIPKTQTNSIVHGDFRLDNVLIDPAANGRRPISAVLDWEMATLGDPLTDLGNLISCWDEAGSPFHPITDGMMALPGMPTRRSALDRYALRTGLDLTRIDWYVTFNLYKLAVILEQIYARDLRGETIGDAADGVGDLALRVLQQAALATGCD